MEGFSDESYVQEVKQQHEMVCPRMIDLPR
jgi:hypothetical protein